MNQLLYSYRSGCGGLEIQERPDGSFRIDVAGNYNGIAPQVLVNIELEERMAQAAAAAMTPEKRREAEMLTSRGLR